MAHFTFFTVYFASPLELDIGARGQNTTVMGLPDRTRSLTISSAMWIQSTNVTDRRHTANDSNDLAFA